MNEQTNQPPPLHDFAGETPLGEDPNDHVPVVGAAGVIEAVLRHPRRIVYQLSQGNAPAPVIALMFAIALVFIAGYGLIVGSFSGREQWWQAPLKITGGLLASGLICLPSLYIFSCLGGSAARLREVAGALGGLLALTTLLLVGFAPVAWIFSQSTESVATMGALHLAFWLVAVGFGARFLARAFHHFGLRSDAGLKAWIIIFLVVSLQMTTALRPLLGPAGQNLLPTEKKFFLAHWMDSLDGVEKPGR
jgi:hypothetical protein